MMGSQKRWNSIGLFSERNPELVGVRWEKAAIFSG
jgi:hypothetical protein